MANSFYAKVQITSLDSDCSHLYIPSTAQRFVVRHGIRYPATVRTLKSACVEHKTHCGKWLSKVLAIRQGLSTTGETRRVESTGQTYYIACMSVKK